LRIAIIPVRGGSKGIARKNFQEVGGKSLLERAVLAAKSANFDEIIVSTDSSELSDSVKQYDVVIHSRSVENSSDAASTESVILEVIQDLGAKWPTNSSIALMQATSPFIRSETINSCLDIADSGRVGFTAHESHLFIWRQSQDEWQPLGHNSSKRERRQDRLPEVYETGAVYAFPLEKFKKEQTRFCAPAIPVLVTSEEAIEIDTPADLENARRLANQFELQLGKDRSRLTLPKLLVTDFDGCLTDDRVILNESGQESVILNRKDGLAVGSFAKLGIPLLILSTEKNPVVAKRAEKLKVPYIQGATDKFSEIKSYLNEKQIDLLDVWYVGNDINDLEVMTHVGLSICPNDAVAEVLSIAQWVLKTKGGAGVLAEIVSNLKGIKK